MKSFSPTNLYYLISFACNERCTKCHHWAIRPAFTPLDSSLVAHAIISLPDLTEFCIVGGEPLLFRDRIISVLDAIKDHPCRTVLITNGVLMDAAFINRIAKLAGERREAKPRGRPRITPANETAGRGQGELGL